MDVNMAMMMCLMHHVYNHKLLDVGGVSLRIDSKGVQIARYQNKYDDFFELLLRQIAVCAAVSQLGIN